MTEQKLPEHALRPKAPSGRSREPGPQQPATDRGAWIGGLVLALLLLLGTRSAQATAPLQQAQLRSAQNYLRSAIADIRAAQSSAGSPSRPARGGRLKLTLMRLASAKQKLAKADQLLKGFGANNPSAQSLRKSYESALKVLNQLYAMVSPKKAPAKEPARVPAKGPAGVGSSTKSPTPPTKTAPKLGYKQRDQLKNVRWYLRETQKYMRPAQELLKRMDGAGSKPVVSEVRKGYASLQQAAKKFKLAAGYLKPLPASHPEVAQMREKLRATGQLLGALGSRLKAETNRLNKATSLSSFPDYKKDFDLVGALSQRYGNIAFLAQYPEKLAKIIKEDGKALKEFQRIAKTYQALADQKTPQGKAMEKRLQYALRKRQTFIKSLKAYVQSLPQEIDRYLNEVRRLSQEGVTQKKPLFFGKNSGIAQQLGFAEQKLTVLRALGEEKARPFAEKIAAVRKQVQEAAKSLEAEIIANNQMPPDRYRKPDRDSLIKTAIATWLKDHKGAKVLTARIPAESWHRITRWDWYGSAFHKVDYSKLQVQLILQHNDKLAVIRPINIIKEHLKGDSIRSFPFDGKTDKLQPHRFIPLSRVK